MANVAFSSFQFNELPIDYDPKDESVAAASEEDPWFELDGNGFMDLFSSVFDQGSNTITMEKNSDEVAGEFSENIQSDFASKNFQEKQPNSLLLPSLDLLKSYKGLNSRMPVREETWNYPAIHEAEFVEQKLSTDEILRIAGEKFIQFSSNRSDGISTFIHPYGSSLSGLSMEDTRDVEIIHYLLAAAEHVASNQRLDLANELISRCLWMASATGTPIQRLAFYFAEALLEKMNTLTVTEHYGSLSKTGERKQDKLPLALGTNNAFIASHQQLPFAQVMQFAAVQIIIENVGRRGRIHLIDLQIRSGVHCTALMQGLADNFPIEGMKLTVVTTPDYRSSDEETCTRLLDFARSLNLPFSFEIVCVNNLGELREEMLSIERDEAVAVYANIVLRSMISKPAVMENVMRVMRRLKPAVMVVVEVEANHNSPSFIDRFTEALLFYNAFFDCLEDCMARDDQYRAILERTYFGGGITNIVAADGESRVTRSVRLDVWRAFFDRFRMIELEIGESARYQASLVLKRFVHGKHCSLESGDGNKGIIVGWKGTPLHSLTAWKFS